MPASSQRLILATLLALAVALYFVDLGGASIWDANEAFYVETPREMMERGDYVFPTFNYEPRVNKPVLSYWIVAGFYQIFGISVAAERFAIALGGVGLIAVAFVLGWAATARRELAMTTALWAALGLAVAPRVVMFSRRIFIDIWISFFAALTLMCFALAERYPERRRTWLVLMYVAAGLGVLTKGPIAIAMPVLAFGAYLLVFRELRRLREMMLPLGALIVLAIVVPWYAALYARSGWTDIANFFLGENLARFTDGVGAPQNRPIWFYLPVVFSDSFPWSLLLIPAIAAMWRFRSESADRAARVRWVMLLWMAAFVGFFSLSAEKQDLYIFPIVPAIAALGAWAVVSAVPGLTLAAAVLGALLAVAGGLFLFLFRSASAVYALDGVTPIALVAIATGVVALALASRRRAPASLLTVLAGSLVLNWIFVLVLIPSFEKYKPSPELSAMLLERSSLEDTIIQYKVDMPSMVFYMRRHIDVIYDLELFLRSMHAEERIFALLWEDQYTALKPELPPTCLVHRTPLFNIKARAILKREPLPHLVLITNRCAAS
jgi:4-amino-4-deoxy-L-arabinose transferase-like glycosyltransferase